MQTVISLLVFSVLLQLVTPGVAFVTSFRAVAQLVSQESRVFSGESVRLKCSVPDGHQSSWRFSWFRGSELLPQAGTHLILWNVKVQDSGKFYCQGEKDSVVGKIRTLQSLPVEISVDGGWAILQVPPHPSFVGNTLRVACRVRGEPELHEVVLYKNGFEVMRQRGPDPTFDLSNLTLKDMGMYSCRASWDAHRRTVSVISSEAPVQVLEALSQPALEIDTDSDLIPEDKMKLICHLQYNIPAPAPPVQYYFYESDHQLGMTSENHHQVKRTPGRYRCMAKVPELGLSRWSEPQTFGQHAGPKTTPSFPRDSGSFPSLISPPNSLLPMTAQPSPQQPASTFLQPTDVRTQPSNPQPNPSPSAPSTQSTTVQPIKQTAVSAPVNKYMENGETSEGSGDLPEGSGDMFGGSGDLPEGSGDMFEGSGDLPEGSGDMP